MATHQFLTVKDGGYFYRFYPNFPKDQQPDDRSTVELLLFTPPPQQTSSKDHFKYLYGKFIQKHNIKDPIVELQQHGKILLFDCNTSELEERELTSLLSIRVPENIFTHPFVEGLVYLITPDSVTDITPLP